MIRPRYQHMRIGRLTAFSLMIRLLISGQLKLFHKKQKTPPQAASPPDPADEESGKEASA